MPCHQCGKRSLRSSSPRTSSLLRMILLRPFKSCESGCTKSPANSTDSLIYISHKISSAPTTYLVVVLLCSKRSRSRSTWRFLNGTPDIGSHPCEHGERKLPFLFKGGKRKNPPPKTLGLDVE